MWSTDYFSDMSLADWIGVALMTPFLLAMLTLFVYIVIGMIGSRARVRRAARATRDTSQQPSQPRPTVRPHQAPGD